MSNYKMKVSVISGASHALEYKAKYPNATDQEVLKYITAITDDILAKIKDKDE